VKAFRFFPPAIFFAAAICLFGVSAARPRSAQVASQTPSEKTQEKPAAKAAPKLPAEIELLETSVRFETDGSSRKEVHARVKINDELGVRQFARLNFDFNRAFEQVEIPLVRITHASGGTADVLPSAITDNPNPAVVNAPAYQDVRVKSVRILGLEPGDALEYRVTTTRKHSALPPDFWLAHSFDSSGVVSQELFQLNLPAAVLAPDAIIVVKSASARREIESWLGPPAGCGTCSTDPLIDAAFLRTLPLKPRHSSPATNPAKAAETSEPERRPPPDDPLPPAAYGKVQIFLKPALPEVSVQKSGEGDDARVTYTWRRIPGTPEAGNSKVSPALEDLSDIQVGKTSRWGSLSYELHRAFALPGQIPEEVANLAQKLTAGAETPRAKTERLYDFVAQKIGTIDLPLGTAEFQTRALSEILSSGYAVPEDKFFLFEALAKAAKLDGSAALIGASKKIDAIVVRPGAFDHLLVSVLGCDCWLDPSLEVAPFGMLPAAYRGSIALVLGADDGPLVDFPASSMMFQIPEELPFHSSQKVDLKASLDGDGKLTTEATYVMRGDNELLLRVAFHQAPKENWKNVAQLLALSDGFRGQITDVTASDPYATKEPFEVTYKIEQPKFLDWKKKTLRIPALLPQLGLPDPPAKSAPGAAAPPIELGTPLDIEVSMTLHLPDGTTAHIPTGTSVERDFATYTSKYSAKDGSLTATRHLNFILKELPADRATDYNAFLRTVQNDESQVFTLERPTADTTPAAKPQKP
jgi:hypothetical protein